MQRHLHLALALLALLALPLASPRAAPQDGASYRDWTTRCETPTADGPRTCYIFQSLLLKKEQKRILHVAVGYLVDEEPAAFFTLPLGVSLPGGVSVTVDDGQPVRLRYERCDGNGCLAPLALNDTLIRAFKGGRWARVAFFDASRREISVPVSLLGFTAGFNALR